MEYVVIGLGGFLGANVRYVLTVWAAQRFGPSFPIGTLFINITGSFLIGLVLIGFGERISPHPYYRLFFATGFLGAYTTFSTFSYDTLLLMQQQNWPAVAVNIVGSVILSLVGVILGAMAARLL